MSFPLLESPEIIWGKKVLPGTPLEMALFMQLPSSTVSLRLHFILLLALCYRTKGAVKLPPNVSVPAVLAFGDSIMDTGNNNNIKTLVKCNFPPYGKDFEGGIPTGRFCNGKIPSDLLGTLSSLYSGVFPF